LGEYSRAALLYS
jgi:hypothetical protein